MSKRCIDFMIVGVQKGGTTALASFLSAHPQLMMAKVKEVHLFDSPHYSPSWSVADIDKRYERYFSASQSAGCLCGEATPIYLYWPEIIPELYRYNPQMRLIVILRDPVERAVSQYSMEYDRGNERRSLPVALLLEYFRLKRSTGREGSSSRRIHSYIDRGKYAQQLQTLRRHFQAHQILILDNSELRSQHQLTLQRVYAFLGVDKSVSAPEESVFKGREVHVPAMVRMALRLYFFPHNRRLRRLLADMGVHADWPWLKRE